MTRIAPGRLSVGVAIVTVCGKTPLGAKVVLLPIDGLRPTAPDVVPVRPLLAVASPVVATVGLHGPIAARAIATGRGAQVRAGRVDVVDAPIRLPVLPGPVALVKVEIPVILAIPTSTTRATAAPGPETHHSFPIFCYSS